MKNPIKLTPALLKRIIQEEREKLSIQAEKVKEASKKKKIQELKREVKTFLQLKKEQKYLLERIKKIQARTKQIKHKIKGE